MIQLTTLFPVSAEARIIQYMIMEYAEDSESKLVATNIAVGCKINLRTVRTRMPKLIKYGIVKTGKKTTPYGTRPMITYMLNLGSKLTATLISLQLQLTEIKK